MNTKSGLNPTPTTPTRHTRQSYLLGETENMALINSLLKLNTPELSLVVQLDWSRTLKLVWNHHPTNTNSTNFSKGSRHCRRLRFAMQDSLRTRTPYIPFFRTNIFLRLKLFWTQNLLGAPICLDPKKCGPKMFLAQNFFSSLKLFEVQNKQTCK